MNFNKNISKRDERIILWMAFKKALRGFFRKPFFKSSHGLLLVGKHVQITHGEHICVGNNVKFEDYAEIHGLCSDGLVFGNDVTIGRGVMIRPSSYYGGDFGKGLIIGDNSSIGPYGYVGCSGKIVIGKNVMLGPKCSLFAENHVFKDINRTVKSQGVVQEGITIEDDCWIGSNVVILDGVTIKSGSVIAAGTIVSKNIQENSLVIDKRNTIIKKRF
jgi:acetyltransferase-like isoleucine patch superfamily enzyme